MINACEYKEGYNFNIVGVSYIGNPKENTVMYVGYKIADMLVNLIGMRNILCFTDEEVDIPQGIQNENAIIKVRNPQLEYSKVAVRINNLKMQEESKIGYDYINGSYVSKSAKIGDNVVIEPGCLIGHDVVIGCNALIMSGTIIKYSIIGDNFVSNEGATIGVNAYTMASDEMNNKIRIPSLGMVIIGDEVEVGANNTISRGSVSDTIIKDNVKLDALVHIGHDVVIEKNTELAAGTIVGGFCKIGENSFVGLNATLKNRIYIGENSFVGMGAAVMKAFPENLTIIGNPAKGILS